MGAFLFVAFARRKRRLMPADDLTIRIYRDTVHLSLNVLHDFTDLVRFLRVSFGCQQGKRCDGVKSEGARAWDIVALLNAFSQGSGASLNDMTLARLAGRLDIFSCELGAW
ncbi:hypothetical protein D3C77_523070 [compost metagenome]